MEDGVNQHWVTNWWVISFQFGWYTRRVGLAGIYKVTELYMLQDNSEEFRNTYNFLKTRMDEAVLLNKLLDSTEATSEKLQNAVGAVFSTVGGQGIITFDFF